jgi:hypothetical protein
MFWGSKQNIYDSMDRKTLQQLLQWTSTLIVVVMRAVHSI